MRKEKIASILSSTGYASIASRSGRLGVSEMTICRDLEALVQDGVLERAHGAAAPLAAIDGRNRIQKAHMPHKPGDHPNQTFIIRLGEENYHDEPH